MGYRYSISYEGDIPPVETVRGGSRPTIGGCRGGDASFKAAGATPSGRGALLLLGFGC